MGWFEYFPVEDFFVAHNLHNFLRLCLKGLALEILERGDPASGMGQQSKWLLLQFFVESVLPFFATITERTSFHPETNYKIGREKDSWTEKKPNRRSRPGSEKIFCSFERREKASSWTPRPAICRWGDALLPLTMTSTTDRISWWMAHMSQSPRSTVSWRWVEPDYLKKNRCFSHAKRETPGLMLNSDYLHWLTSQ